MKKKDFQFLFFGGSFDPVHLGHLLIAKDVKEKLNFNYVVFIPAYISPFKKDRKITHSYHRLKMLELATENIPYFLIEDWEIKRKEISYTYHTVIYLKEKYCLERVYWLMGDDTFLGLHKWFNIKALFEEGFTPVVVLRKESDFDSLKKYAKEYLQKPLEELLFVKVRKIEISSTEIRNRIKEGKDITFLLPEKVEEYILKNQLYI